MAGSNGGRSSRNSNNSSNEFYRGMVQSYIEKVWEVESMVYRFETSNGLV